MIDKILKDIKGLFKVQDKVKFLKQNIPYLAFFYIGNIFSHHVRAYIGGDIIDKIFQGILELNTMSFLPSIHPTDIIMGVVFALFPEAPLFRERPCVEATITASTIHHR